MSEHAKAMKSIKSAITRFDKAAQNYSVRGAYMPVEAIEIEVEYKHCRKLLEELIDRLLQSNTSAEVKLKPQFETTIALLNEPVRE